MVLILELVTSRTIFYNFQEQMVIPSQNENMEEHVAISLFTRNYSKLFIFILLLGILEK